MEDHEAFSLVYYFNVDKIVMEYGLFIFGSHARKICANHLIRESDKVLKLSLFTLYDWYLSFKVKKIS